jgi:hypothetical protein
MQEILEQKCVCSATLFIYSWVYPMRYYATECESSCKRARKTCRPPSSDQKLCQTRCTTTLANSVLCETRRTPLLYIPTFSLSRSLSYSPNSGGRAWNLEPPAWNEKRQTAAKRSSARRERERGRWAKNKIARCANPGALNVSLSLSRTTCCRLGALILVEPHLWSGKSPRSRFGDYPFILFR